MEVKVFNINGKESSKTAVLKDEIFAIKQKGTGGARRGDIKSPLLHGGARVFGPHSRDYGIKVNKKVQQLARKSALSYKATDGAIRVVDNINFDTPKTAKMLEMIKNFDSVEKKLLIVLDESNKVVSLSSRNLKKVKVVTASKLNTYDILNAQIVMFSEASLPKLDNFFLLENE